LQNTTTSQKTLLFLSYGGAHPYLLLPIIKAMKNKGYKVKIASFTSGIQIYKKFGYQVISAKDITTKDDFRILKYGKILYQDLVKSQQNIFDIEETIAYLGLSFNDYVDNIGDFQIAYDQYKKLGRSEFLPLTLIKRIFKLTCPDMLITTNSPRAEKAAIQYASSVNIPSLQITDLFCNYERYQLNATAICVANKVARNNLINNYSVDSERIYITGSPDFDKFIHLRTQLSKNKISIVRKKIGLEGGQKYLFWNDQKTIITGTSKKTFERNTMISLKNLSSLVKIVNQMNYKLIVKCHSSQNAEEFLNWCNKNNAIFANNAQLSDYLLISDIVVGMSSTVLINAYNLGKPIILLNQTLEESFLPILNYKGVKEIESLSQLNKAINYLKNIGEISDSIGDGNSVVKISKLIDKIIKLPKPNLERY